MAEIEVPGVDEQIDVVSTHGMIQLLALSVAYPFFYVVYSLASPSEFEKAVTESMQCGENDYQPDLRDVHPPNELPTPDDTPTSELEQWWQEQTAD